MLLGALLSSARIGFGLIVATNRLEQHLLPEF
jgi:hypothetical protein